MIDLVMESTTSLAEAARLLPSGRGGRPVTASCLLRWILAGARLASGGRVRLEALRLGGRWITSREALQRFAMRLTPDQADEASPLPSFTARKKASAVAKRRLEKSGPEKKTAADKPATAS
jgi:hypothetical protein